MKKRQAAAALLTMAMIGTALAGCGSTDGASATESSEAAAEETAEDTGAEAEEAADAEDTAAEDAAGEEEAEADGEEFMPDRRLMCWRFPTSCTHGMTTPMLQWVYPCTLTMRTAS